MSQKIILAFIPKEYLITAAIATVIRLLGIKFIIVSNIVIDGLLILIAYKIAIVIHEFGHWVFSIVVGATPRRVVLGSGHEILRKDIKGVKLIINSKINSGLFFPSYQNLNFIKFKLLAVTSGGFLLNLGFALVLYFAFGFDTNILAGSKGIKIVSALIVANIFSGLFSMIPFYANFNGLKIATDGLTIFKIPFYQKEELTELLQISDWLDAFDYYEAQEYKKAIEVYERCQRENPESKGLNINLSSAYLKLGQIDRAIFLLKELEEVIEEKGNKEYKTLLFNNLAWCYLLTLELDLADKYSALAFKLAPKEEVIKGTRALILIELGKLKEGEKLIVNSIDFKFPNGQTLSDALYFGYALHQEGNLKKASKYLDFVNEHLEKLGLDEKLLYDRVMKKIKKEKGIPPQE